MGIKITILKSSEILLKLTKLLMKNGKKKKILKRVTSSLQKFSQNKEAYSGFCMLTSMFYKIKPLLETVKVRKGSKYYDFPYYIKPQRSISILLRWSVKYIKKHLEKQLNMAEINNLYNQHITSPKKSMWHYILKNSAQCQSIIQ